MADAAVEFLLQNLQQLLTYHVNLIRGVKDQVEKLEKHLRLFKSFLQDTTMKRWEDKDNNNIQELVRQIGDVVFEAEAVIDSFLAQATESKASNWLSRAFKTPVELHGIAQRVESLIADVDDIYKRIDFTNFNSAGVDSEDSEAPLVRRDQVVGFEDEAQTLIGYLNEQTEKLDVISIVGMPGLGKTTLAGKIFHDPAIQAKFPKSIWVYVSSELKPKRVFLAILRKLIDVSKDMHDNSDDELAQKVADELKKLSGKFLIVFDDVWTIGDWDKLKVALSGNVVGKVLITSRHQRVAQHANPDRVLNLRLLNQDESWLLLRLEVFGKPECPAEFNVPGHLIAKKCGGLPLALVVIGGILPDKKDKWDKVSETVKPYLDEEEEGRMKKIIFLSYNKLPYHLRPCFLYLGMFPQGFTIPVWKLFSMWIAEGFIPQKPEISLEETAENYLEDLISRNLVVIDKTSLDGRVTKCHVHDMLHDFCKNESENENFLQEIRKSANGGFEPQVSDIKKFRRLSIHDPKILDIISSELPSSSVRSFVCFSSHECPSKIENISAILDAFKSLKVFDVNSIELTKVSSRLYHLVHLRYMSLCISSPILSPSFSKLWNIQTLIIGTTSPTLDIKADIWQLLHLRHLKTNASTLLPKPGKTSKGGEKLQTLGTISPKSCKEKVFDRASNLKKLGIRGRLNFFLEKETSFGSLRKLDNLEALKLINDPDRDAQLRDLPPYYKFPPTLRSLTLYKTYLSWNHMPTLGFLEHLEVLKLKEKAFVGNSWQLKGRGGFPRLEVLHIGRTDLLIWEASGDYFTSLKRLELHNCEQLHEIPIALADISTFQLLHLYNTRSAVASAQRICDAKQETSGEFKLSVSS